MFWAAGMMEEYTSWPRKAHEASNDGIRNILDFIHFSTFFLLAFLSPPEN
jgi:hypothetical protein